MPRLRLLYKAMALCVEEVCTLIISGKGSLQAGNNVENNNEDDFFLILVTFSMLLFGTLIYIMDNSEPQSNIRNILGRRTHRLD